MTNKLAFQAHQILQNKLRPLADAVIVTDMVFDERLTSGGIVLLNDNGKGTGIRPRWAQVYAIGPDQKDLAVGQWICVAHGRWTRGIDVEDETGKHTLRRIDPKDVLLVSNQQPQDDTFSDAVHIDRKPDHMLHS
jgi:co-chaperonin GroES (HSP10)